MKIVVNKDKLTIKEEQEEVKSGAIEYYKADLEFDSSWDGLIKKVVLIKKDEEVGQDIAVINNKISLNIDKSDLYYIGIIGFTEENKKKIYQISTNLEPIFIDKGSGEIETEEHIIPSANEWEIYIAQIQSMCNQNYSKEETDKLLENKVDKIEGKELSTNDFTNKYKENVDNNTTNNHTHTNKSVLDNTTASFTAEKESKLNNIEDNANNYVLPEDVVQDADYVHTDNNFSDDKNNKLNELENYDDADVREDISNLNINKADKTEIPDVSDFITNTVDNLINYYLKSETYTKNEINNLIGQIHTASFQVVEELPTQGQNNIIYLLLKTPNKNDIYDEYIWINNNWEHIGSTEVDLTGYATEEWVNFQISDLLNQTEVQTLITNALTNYYTKNELNSLLNNKDDKVNINTELTTIIELSNNTEYRRNVLSELVLSLHTIINDDYISSVVFESGETATTITYPNTIKFSGDDVSEGVFVPTVSKTYNIIFWYDGINTNAVVRGV